MCVIFIVDGARPTDEMVEKAFNANDAGAGVAWREGGKVHWEKGIQTIPEMQHFCTNLPTPYIAHFRIPTEGGRRPSLCHPFPIEKDAPLDLKGSTDGYVLFHNGHWSKWRDESHRTVKDFQAKFPSGKWSDTRAMAMEAAYYGIGVLEMINEKAVAFGPKDMEIIAGGGWHQSEGIWCSNIFWKNRGTNPNYGNYATHRMCLESGCTSYNIDQTRYCPEHRKVINLEILPAEDKEEDSQPGHATADSVDGAAVDTFEDEGGKVRTGLLGTLRPHGKAAITSDGAPGGEPIHGPFDLKRLPFRLVEQLWLAKKISKKQFKKARKLDDEKRRKAAKGQGKQRSVLL